MLANPSARLKVKTRLGNIPKMNKKKCDEDGAFELTCTPTISGTLCYYYHHHHCYFYLFIYLFIYYYSYSYCCCCYSYCSEKYHSYYEGRCEVELTVGRKHVLNSPFQAYVGVLSIFDFASVVVVVVAAAVVVVVVVVVVVRGSLLPLFLFVCCFVHWFCCYR
jgi:hypothetical protein